MSKRDELEQVYAEIQIEMAKALLEKIKSGVAVAADMNVARQLLKDNGITSTIQGNPTLGEMRLALPDFPDEQSEVA